MRYGWAFLILLSLMIANNAFANQLYGLRIFSNMVYVKSENELVGTQALLIPSEGGLKVLLQFAMGVLMDPELFDCKEGALNKNGDGYCKFIAESQLWNLKIEKNKAVLIHPNGNQDVLTEITKHSDSMRSAAGK